MNEEKKDGEKALTNDSVCAFANTVTFLERRYVATFAILEETIY